MLLQNYGVILTKFAAQKFENRRTDSLGWVFSQLKRYCWTVDKVQASTKLKTVKRDTDRAGIQTADAV